MSDIDLVKPAGLKSWYGSVAGWLLYRVMRDITRNVGIHVAIIEKPESQKWFKATTRFT